MILNLLLSSVLAYVIWCIFCLESNVRKARAIGVPVVRLPIDGFNIPWITFQPLVWSVLDRLPFPWSSYPTWVRFSRRGWQFADKSETQVRLGPVWALATPLGIHLQFADPAAIGEIFSRREDFVRPIKEYRLLEIYGPCISTAGWDDWARHRKPLAAPFNESIMTLVWDESLKQAQAMLRSWTSASATESGIPSVQKDTRTLSLNVLAATGFRQSYDFHGSADGPVVGDVGNYRDSLQTVLDGAILLMLVPVRLLSAPMMPKSWAKLGKAAAAFKKYMEQMLDTEIAAVEAGEAGSGRILTAFVHALAEHNAQPETHDVAASSGKSRKKGLSVDEIYSNLFIINFAGHNTTANTLAFVMFLLAGHPDVQAWMLEEIEDVTQNVPIDEWDYVTLFPQLTRCRAVFLETLRLYPPVMLLPKWTSKNTQTLSVGGKLLHIPPETTTNLYLLALQTHPKYWVDPYVWKPSRWITPSADVAPSSSASLSDTPKEKLLVPRKGTYIPWSDGPQNCPGKKFAEVEAVAVLACLFKTHRLAAKQMIGESSEAACKRAVECTTNIDMEVLLRMADADKTRLICREV